MLGKRDRLGRIHAKLALLAARVHLLHGISEGESRMGGKRGSTKKGRSARKESGEDREADLDQHRQPGPRRFCHGLKGGGEDTWMRDKKGRKGRPPPPQRGGSTSYLVEERGQLNGVH